jgi:hypothetical protein
MERSVEVVGPVAVAEEVVDISMPQVSINSLTHD